MTKDEKKKIAENLKKINDAMKQLPSLAPTFAEKKLPTIPTFELSENAVIELCEKGIFSEEFKQKIYEGTAKYSTELLESAAKEGASVKIKQITCHGRLRRGLGGVGLEVTRDPVTAAVREAVLRA